MTKLRYMNWKVLNYMTKYRIKVVLVASILILSGCPTIGETTEKDGSVSETGATPVNSPIHQSTTEVLAPTTAPPKTETVFEPTEPPTKTQTRTVTDRKQTATPPNSNHPYREFAIAFNQGLERYAAIPLPILAFGNRTDTWYVVINSSAPSKNQTRHDAQWKNVARAYASAVVDMQQDDSQGRVPSQLTLLDWNNSAYSMTPGTYTVQTEWARALGNESISINEYDKRWEKTVRSQTEREQQIAKEMNRQAANRTYNHTSED